MAIFNSYVSLPEGMYFDKPENHESSSICHEMGGSEMIEAIWALPGSPGSLRHEHPEVVGLGSQRPLRILAFELVPLVPKKMQVTCRRLGWHRHSFVSFPSLWPCHLDARTDIFRCSPLQLWTKIGSSKNLLPFPLKSHKGCPHP